jgi:hypothetical protein
MTPPARRPLCFVVMPYGRKTDATGAVIEFDAIYREAIRQGIDDAGLEPLRADEELAGGIIHKPMFERLVLCEYAVADLTAASANVFYELGVRHAVRPWSTVMLFAEGGRLPFDVALLRAIPYRLTADGKAEDPAALRAAIAERLKFAAAAAKDGPVPDSPLYQLLEGYPTIASDKTDMFRDRVEYAAATKERLRAARSNGLEALKSEEAALGPLRDLEAGVVIDLFLSYRGLSEWSEMARIAESMPKVLAATVLVREQYALALNRLGKPDDAERVLTQLIAERGASSESCGILGRIYKDRWQAAVRDADTFTAGTHLKKAIETYVRGFESNWADAFPGVNAVTLMEVQDKPDPRQAQILPVVRYVVERRIASGKPDYWDYATRLELAILARDTAKADEALGEALVALREPWEAESTAGNIALIAAARERRGDEAGWIRTIEQELRKRAAKG